MQSKLFNIISLLLCSSISYSNGQSDLLQENFKRIDVFETFASAVRNYSLIPEKKISLTCLAHLLKYVNSIEKEWWAFQMYDASTKQFPGSGVLSGNLIHLGDYDECLNVTNGAGISGKYCLATIPLLQFIPKQKRDLLTTTNPETRVTAPEAGSAPAFALCVPDSCSVEDLQKVSALILVNKSKIKFEETLCDAKNERPELNKGDIAAISVLSVILSLVIISTIYEIIIYYTRRKIYHPVLIAFSAFTNTKKILQTSDEPDQITCLHGIRVISMMWVIFGHRYTFYGMVPKTNLVYFYTEWVYQKTSMFALGASVAVDTFLVLSGLLVSYGFMVSTSKGSRFNIIVFYLHRIIRLTPLLGAVILIHATFIRHMGDGPLWKLTMTGIRDVCVENWWTTLLYAQNYATSNNEICIRQSWYLGVDTQLYILSPLILLPLQKWPKFGIILTLVFMAASITASFLVGWMEELYGHMVTNLLRHKGDDFMVYFYYATHARAAPWLLGILIGYYIFLAKKNHRKISINKWLCLLLWAISLALLLFCIFAGQNTFETNYKYNQFLDSFFITFHRPAWALGVAWVIFACVTGHGGPVNWFLSLPIFQVLSKLTYSMFLVHITIIWIVLGQTRSAVYFNNLDAMHTYWGDFIFGYATALIFTLAFESPIIGIERFIFGRKERKPSDKTSVDDIKTEDP